MIDENPTAAGADAVLGSDALVTGSPWHPFLGLRRPFSGPIPDFSVGGVRKVAKPDARSHIIAAREPGGRWFRLRDRTRFTRENIRRLRESGLSQVVLRRRLSRVSFPLGWLSQR